MGNSLALDDVDRTILRMLRQNARMSLQEMSRKTGISDATIQFRLKRMKANGVIEKFTIAANPAATGYAVTAIMLVQTDSEKHDHAMAALAKIPEVTEVYGVLGEHDLYAKIWSRSLEELNAIINDRIRTIEGIEDLLEIVVVERTKEETPPV
ncbi:MAG: Lrp/AsnC family transcriptional regulator [Methanothrix sp.]|nr:MAG: Lrp/AsnC family transcriptional regulator [Methanothrix sp.]